MIREDLCELADEEYRKFQSNLCPGVNNIMGVRIPKLKEYAKIIAKGNYREYLNSAEDEYYEEILLQGLVICYAKMPIEEKLQYVTNFIPKIDNWAVCDIFCVAFKDAKKYPEQVGKYLQKYLYSSKEFEIRFGVIMLLNYFLTEDYIDLVLEKMEKVKKEEYYVKMGVAWLLSVAYVKFPEKTIGYLKGKNSLDEITLKKAIQKIRESTRVSKQEKEEWKNWLEERQKPLTS